MNESLKSRIDDMVKSNEVFLFMKGTPQAPQCGFSATVVGILKQMVPNFGSANVLADPDLRDGIKEYSEWPTIPQLYVKGEFVGGCDIIKDMFAKGDLQSLLGVKMEEVAPPTITITDSAKAALAKALADSGGDPLHLNINERFDAAMDVGPGEGHELKVVANGITVLMDRATAKRANGLSIDFVSTPGQTGFKLDNPNAPPRVKQVSVKELKALLDQGRPIQLFDVRGPDEVAIASIKTARMLDEQALQDIARMSKDTPLYFHCHHGSRSQKMAERFIAEGYKSVHNVVGGVDSWSQEVDSSVPRY